MKIAMLVHNPPFHGGIVQYCVLLENNLNLDTKIIGFKKLYPPFLYKGKLPKENKSGIQFKSHPNNLVKWYNPYTWVKSYFLMKDADILHFHWVSPLLSPLQWVILKLNNLFSKKPTILTCHNIEPHETTFLDKFLINLVFSNVDYFVVHAKQNKKRLVETYKINGNNVYVIPHGDFSFFKNWSQKNKNELKKQFDVENKKVILFFGYIRKYKGLSYLIDSLREVLKHDEDVVLLIAGEVWENWKIYKKQIIKNNLEKYIKVFPYYINDKEVCDFFNVADIVVLPYYNTEQTISGPLLISLAFGKPTIVSNVGGIRELVENNNHCILVQPGNTYELSQKIINLLNNKNLQEKLSRNSLILNKHLSWENVAEKYNELYKKIKC